MWSSAQKEILQSDDGSEIIKTFTYDRDEKYRLQLQHFFDCMENNKEPAVSLPDGAYVMRMVKAARESNLNGKTVTMV